MNELLTKPAPLADLVADPVDAPAAKPADDLAACVLGIDHLALAVPDLDAAAAWIRDVLGFTLVEKRETMGLKTGMKSAVLRLGPVTLVLTEGIGATSQVSQFVEEFGAGVQHVAFRVNDLGKAAAAMEARGLRFSSPRLDSDQLSQIFSIRDGSTGLMVELIERQGGFEGFRDENVQRLFDSLESRNLF